MTVRGDQERRELDEAMQTMRVAGRAGAGVEGWIRTVRRVTGTPVQEMAEKLGVRREEIGRMERSERAGKIGMAKLRGAAEAMGCELVYGLTPKVGTLTEMVAGREAQRKVARAEALKGEQSRRREKARQKRWGEITKSQGTPVWKLEVRRKLRQLLRKEGIWLR